MAKEVVGIYISAKSVDIVELSGSAHMPRLKNFIREDIASSSADTIKDSKDELAKKQDTRRESISLAIKEGLSKMNIRSASARTVLHTSDVMIRYFSMPKMPKSEQAQAVKFEVRKYIPFKVDKLACDFKILPTSSRSKNVMDVFFIAATKDNLSSHLDLFNKADTDAAGVDIIPFALVKALILCRKLTPKDNVAVLYFDNDRLSASIHIIERGIPFLSRDITVIADDKEAFFEKMVSEIRVSLDYYHRQKPQTDVTKVIICGERLYEGLDTFLSDELKVITETLDGFTGLRGAEKVDPSFAISIGAALGGLGKSNYSINLSPFAGVKEKRDLANIIYMEAAATLFIVIAIFIVTSFQSGSLWAKLKKIESQQQDIMPEIASFNNTALKALNTKTIEELKFLELILNDRISWTEILDRLAKDIPNEMWLTGFDAREYFLKTGSSSYPEKMSRSLSIAGNAFSLNGRNREIENISSFLSILKEDKIFADFFDKIELGPIDERRERDHMISSFEINAKRETLDRGRS
ncbi:MAG: pilus assembly protein PilM [Candidatus Omnitrophota bacterium]